MAKKKTAFICQNCGANSPKWLGKCPSCGEWNTYVEELIETVATTPTMPWQREALAGKKTAPVRITEVKSEKIARFSSTDAELDRVLGGGIVNGSIVLIGGEPGIGKSTLMLQVAVRFQQKKILYISGEESLQQIKLRAERLGIRGDSCFLLAETNISEIFAQVALMEPDMLIIDSIQTIHSDQVESIPGSVSQVRECAGMLMRFAKETHTPVFLIGHINKEGNIAGPKVLEHLVDTVLQFEGDRHYLYRILRTIKNRFGSTSELGIYRMRENGLEEVPNPSEMLLSDSVGDASGMAIGALIEGNRPLMVEVQALVSPATYGTPQRSATGFDLKRLHMLIAVMEKRLGLRLGTQDVFVNITGGIRVDDPSLDLAVCAALASSYQDLPISRQLCFSGEVGLGGEVRMVTHIESRIKEASKLGFEKMYVTKQKDNYLPAAQKITLVQHPNLRALLGAVFQQS